MLRNSSSRALRDYQIKIKQEILINQSFGFKNVLAVMPTGAGKTVVMADIARDQNEPHILIAHRQELVSQISMALANAGVYHRIIAPQPVIRFIIERQILKIGSSYHHSGAPVAVAGVDTLIRRTDQLEKFLKQCKGWQTDEGHHLQANNKWGAAVAAIPNAYGIGWTATPLRPNGQSLGRIRGGVFDCMVVGPTPRELIDQDYLCDYKIYGPTSDIDVSNVSVSSSTGDFNSKQLRDAAHRSHITGDIVAHYLRLAAGKRGVTFAVDVAMAEEHAEAFRAQGVPAAVLHAGTHDKDRAKIIDDFERGRLLQIVNVDVLGEGFDCPAIEVVSFARPTQSYGLYVQQFGRGLRVLPGKSHGWIIDHVGNVARHGLPDKGRKWDLDGVEKGARPVDDLPIRTCPECFHVFEGYSRQCPLCDHLPPRQQASRPEQVEGDLIEYSPELLARLRGEADRVVSPCPFTARDAKTSKQVQLWDARSEAQEDLRLANAWWAGFQRDIHACDDSECYRRYWYTFGVDALTAQTLTGTKTTELAEKVWGSLPPEIQGNRRLRSPNGETLNGETLNGETLNGETLNGKTKVELYIERFLPVVSLNGSIMLRLAPDLFKNLNTAKTFAGGFKNETGRYRFPTVSRPSKYYAPDVDLETVRTELSKLHDGAEIMFDIRNVIDIYIERFLPVVSFNRSIMIRLAPDLFISLATASGVASGLKNETGRYRFPTASSSSKYYAPDVDLETVRTELSKLHDGAEIILIENTGEDE